MSHRIVSRLFASTVAVALAGGIGNAADVQTSVSPKVFAPGFISGPAGVDCLAFTPDGNTVFFDQQAGSNGMIMVSYRADDAWSIPQIAPFSGQWLDHDPAVAPDGSFLVFTSNRPDAAGGKALHGGHLWRVDRAGDSWDAPVRLPDAVNRTPLTFAPSIAADGSVYFLQRDAAPGSEFHIFRTQYRNGAYLEPVRLKLGSADSHQLDPSIAPDESFIVFDTNETDHDKPDRLAIAFREGGHWGTPIDLGDALNSYQPWGAHLGPDGHSLYFTSSHATAAKYPRSREQALKDLARMRAWDNGGNHIWSISLAPWLDARKSRGQQTAE